MQPKPRLLVLDNHDSFTYNLLESCRSQGQYALEVMTPGEWVAQKDLSYDKVIISPGPGLPRESPFLFETIELLWGKVPVLGVCLGLQALVEYRGGQIERSEQPFHGLGSLLEVTVPDDPIYKNISLPCRVGRYHSWRIHRESLPAEFQITALDEKGAVMSLTHRELPIYAVQFHPESYISEQGDRMIQNFLEA